MDNTSKKSKSHSLEFITSDNVDQHSHDIETALHLSPNDISILFSDEYINTFKTRLDQALADCINITKKFIQNSMRFHNRDNENVTAFFEKSRQTLTTAADETILQLHKKHDELIKQYTNEVVTARNEIKNTKGYNEAILLADLKKDIILAVQHSSHAPDPHALDNCSDCDLDTFHKKIAAIIKSANHKKQMVHDINKQLKKYAGHDALIFHDKHTVSFTMAAYKMELATINAQQSARAILKAINARLEESVRIFEKEVFLQDHFEKLRRSSTQALSGFTRQ